MATSTDAPPTVAASAPTPTPVEGTLLPAVLRAEWTKLRSVRSSMWSLASTVVVTVGLGALLSWAYVHRYDRLGLGDRLRFDATAHSLRGVFLAQLAIGVLGVLVISSEYTTGLIRTTFAATPQRLSVLASKVVVFGAVALAVGLVASFAGFFAGQSVLAAKNLDVTLGAPHVLRAVVGAGGYLAIIGLLGLALGAIFRRTAGAIAVLFGLVLILPLIAQALPSPWNTDVSQVTPGMAGQAMFTVRPDSDLLSPGWGFVVCLIWLAVAYAWASLLLARRDA